VLKAAAVRVFGAEGCFGTSCTGGRQYRRISHDQDFCLGRSLVDLSQDGEQLRRGARDPLGQDIVAVLGEVSLARRSRRLAPRPRQTGRHDEVEADARLTSPVRAFSCGGLPPTRVRCDSVRLVIVAPPRLTSRRLEKCAPAKTSDG
jgi:hypothetical protein